MYRKGIVVGVGRCDPNYRITHLTQRAPFGVLTTKERSSSLYSSERTKGRRLGEQEETIIAYCLIPFIPNILYPLRQRSSRTKAYMRFQLISVILFRLTGSSHHQLDQTMEVRDGD